MKKYLFTIFIIMLFTFMAYAEDQLLSVNEVIKKLNTSEYTSAQIKEYYKTVKGSQAEGTGKVVNVLPGKKDRHRVTILTDASTPEKGYNVVLYTTMNAPQELKLNDRIKFKGEIGRMSSFRGLSIDIIGTYEKIE